MAEWAAALGLSAVGAAGQAMGGIFQQMSQNQFTRDLLRDQYNYQSNLQSQAFQQSQENKVQTSMINAQQAGISTPASIMKSAVAPSSASAGSSTAVPDTPLAGPSVPSPVDKSDETSA